MANPVTQELLRRLPSVDALLQAKAVQEALAVQPRRLVLESIRQVLDALRKRILENPENAAHESDLDPQLLVGRILERLESLGSHTLMPVVNATGIVVHTNLGRSLLAAEAMERLQLLCAGYNNLEYDLGEGRRGSRYVHAEAILCELTGAKAALVVNNNAAAVLLVLNTLANGREVVVSRGQLVEIGGSFRIPDVMRSSGAVLKEVGTTNRTHPKDYEAGICGDTALLMKVHTSNYRIVGFTTGVGMEEMAAIAHRHGLPAIEDLGSGSFVDLSPFGLKGEPTVQDSVRAGADAVTFSGDKLLGGPQAGIIVGAREIVDRCKQNPLTRALRVDKMTLAALEATLRLYRDERGAIRQIPTLRMLAATPAELEERARSLASQIQQADRDRLLDVQVLPGFSQVGGGALPEQDIETRVVAVRSESIGTQKIEAALRSNTPPVIGRIEFDRCLLDVRTIQPDEFVAIREAFERMLAGTAGSR
ncbi:MAG: L-seryl-tRNA(Sec) selenium transferase [Syntrophobacteraceae bacterium]